MMSVEQAKEVRHYCCERKNRYSHREQALEDSTVKKGAHAYRCPFCRGWHVGRVASIESLERIAEAIRVLAQADAA